jgi:PGF-CTERM protein
MYEDIYEAMEGEHPWEFDWWNILPEIANTEVTFWKVYDDNGYPTLLVKLHTNVAGTLHLLDPDGLKVSSGYITKEDIATKLRMGKYQTTPKAGKYTLTVYRVDLSGTKIAEKVFEFEGAKISIESIDPEFEESFGDYYLDGVRVIIENKGDLPAYIEKVVVTVDGKREHSWHESISIGPMSESVADLYSGSYISEIESGDKKVTVEGMCGRKIVVRGSKEVHLEKISIPGFGVIFAIIGLLAIAYLLRRRR